MRAYVFTDASLSRHARQFVWLEIDTEKGQNAAIRKRLKANALPTFYVLDPATEQVALRWVGGATVPQLHKLLDDGRAAVMGGPGLDAKLALADRLYGESDNAGAARAYEEALAAAPPDWPHYARAVESLLFSLSETGEHEKVVTVAKEAGDRLGRSTSGLSVASSGLGNALELPVEHPMRKEMLAYFETIVTDLVRDRSIVAAADDRSSTYGQLADARDDAKDEEGKKKVLNEWAAFLEGEAAKAKTPEQRAVFDSHRLNVYIELGQPERALPMLQASERDFPDDYNPPARLATALNAMKRYDEALAASDRALQRVYGPRKLRVLQTRTDIYTGKGDTEAARRTLEEAVGTARSPRSPISRRS